MGEDGADSTAASNTTTLENSLAPSVTEKGKETEDIPHDMSTTLSNVIDEKNIETPPEVGESTTADTGDEEDSYDYPRSTTLAFVTIALMLSVFCMALGMCNATGSQVIANPKR